MLSWAVTGTPWVSGDKLMVRIRNHPSNLTRTSRILLISQANPHFEGFVYSKKWFTFSGRVLL